MVGTRTEISGPDSCEEEGRGALRKQRVCLCARTDESYTYEVFYSGVRDEAALHPGPDGLSLLWIPLRHDKSVLGWNPVRLRPLLVVPCICMRFLLPHAPSSRADVRCRSRTATAAAAAAATMTSSLTAYFSLRTRWSVNGENISPCGFRPFCAG